MQLLLVAVPNVVNTHNVSFDLISLTEHAKWFVDWYFIAFFYSKRNPHSPICAHFILCLEALSICRAYAFTHTSMDASGALWALVSCLLISR